MNLAIVILSLASVLYFAVPQLINSNDVELTNETDIQATKLIKISLSEKQSILLAQLQSEAETLKNQQAEAIEKAENKAEPKLNQNELVFGGEVFLLLGIFNQKSDSFVIIKNSQQQLVKAMLGDTLGADVKLVAVTNNTITLANSQETKEFKLFQRQSNE